MKPAVNSPTRWTPPWRRGTTPAARCASRTGGPACAASTASNTITPKSKTCARLSPATDRADAAAAGSPGRLPARVRQKRLRSARRAWRGPEDPAVRHGTGRTYQGRRAAEAWRALRRRGTNPPAMIAAASSAAAGMRVARGERRGGVVDKASQSRPVK